MCRPYPPFIIALSHEYLDRHLMHGLWPTRVHTANSISTGSLVFAGLTIVTDRLTDHTTLSVTIGRIYVGRTDMRSKK